MELEEILKAQGVTDESIADEIKERQERQKESHKQLQELYKNKGFSEVIKKLPEVGTILRPMKGDVVEVTQDIKKNKDRKSEDSPERLEIRFVRAAVDSKGTGWYLTKDVGVTCLITLHSFDNILEYQDKLFVSDLEVIRISATGKALICRAL